MKPAKTIPALIVALITATSASTALAEDGPDMDGDGLLTMDEVVAAWPDVTENAFIAADADANGTLDEAEVAAAVEAGLIPAEEM